MVTIIVLGFLCAYLWLAHGTYSINNKCDVDDAVEKAKKEDERLRKMYNMPNYEDEKKRNEELKSEYEMLRLQEENKKLEEEIQRLKYNNGNE